MRVVSWNIERGYFPQKTVEFLESLNADIYCLYELDKGVARTKNIDMMKILESGLGMRGNYVTEFLELESWVRKVLVWEGAGGGEIGNAVFVNPNSGLQVKNYFAQELEENRLQKIWRPRIGFRKAQILRLEKDGKEFTVVATHLELWKLFWTSRKRQLENGLKNFKAEDFKNIILCGDFNNVSGVLWGTILGIRKFKEIFKVRRWLETKKLKDPFLDTETTCGRWIFQDKIDWLAFGENFQITSKQNIKTDLSDHNCLVVDFVLR